MSRQEDKNRRLRANPTRGANIRELRDELGLTRRQIARAIDVSEKSVENWENGHGIETRFLKPLAHFLRATPDELNGTRLAAQLNERNERLGRIERALAELTALVRTIAEQQGLDADGALLEAELEEPTQSQGDPPADKHAGSSDADAPNPRASGRSQQAHG